MLAEFVSPDPISMKEEVEKIEGGEKKNNVMEKSLKRSAPYPSLIAHHRCNISLLAPEDATQVANLQRQLVNSRLITSEYLEANLDLMDQLIPGYEDPVIALHYGGMLRECI
ncbi:putative MO25-like protein [Abeliophyllum distichum]|uniref:MO25-like protein n=1 Tax=Abeliophyllum distichum TaxID=126358 RepID=A0ABD1PVF6_9LAMI